MPFNDKIAEYVVMFCRIAHYPAIENEWIAINTIIGISFPSLIHKCKFCVWEKPQMKKHVLYYSFYVKLLKESELLFSSSRSSSWNCE